MKKSKFIGLLLALAVCAFSVVPAQAAVITLQSGNGVAGGLDGQVTVLVGPAATGFTAAFSPADFAAAAAGTSAFIQANTHAAYAASLAGYVGAQWLSTNSNGANWNGAANTGLYAISFNLASVALSSAVLDFSAYVDNQLGDAINQGVFINGVAIAGSSGGSFSGTAFSFTGANVLSSLVVGLNTLYINAANLGGPGGVLFGATLTTTPSVAVVPVSLPGVLALIGLGFMLMLGFSSKRKLYVRNLSM